MAAPATADMGGEGTLRGHPPACNPSPRHFPARAESGGSRPSLTEEAFVSLEALSRDAANASLRAKGGHLADDQFDSLAVHLLGVGIRAFERFDPALTLSAGDGFNFAWRAMRGYRKIAGRGVFTEGPYVDWLRTHVRDARFEPESLMSVTETGDTPEDGRPLVQRPAVDVDSLELVVRHYARDLAEREAWTLRHVASALASGFTLAEVCETLLADLADALRPQMEEAPAIPGPSLEFFRSWFEEAA